jgi:hypothetical protein
MLQHLLQRKGKDGLTKPDLKDTTEWIRHATPWNEAHFSPRCRNWSVSIFRVGLTDSARIASRTSFSFAAGAK